MNQKPYVDNEGKRLENNNSKKIIFLGIFVIVFILLLVVYFIGTNNGKKKRMCNSLEDMLESASKKYAGDNNILPKINGTYVIISSEELKNKGYLNEDYSLKNNPCSGSVKLTKVDDDFVATIDVTDCGYCTTDKRYGDFGKEVSKYSKETIVDVIPYYNYVSVNTYYTKWTNYYNLDVIKKEPFNSVSDKRFPSIPSDAKNVAIETDTLTYYSYRDLEWKFYKNNGGVYTNYFSSEKPDGFAFKDNDTARSTEYTDWSLNYPDRKDYRTIKESKGYRWYYMNGKTKVYWNGGAYYPTEPSPEFTEHEKESVNMYSYSDMEWRWYNGAKRSYTSFRAVMPNDYPNRDEGLSRYTSWSSFITTSKLDNSNRNYREERQEERPRYRLKYDIYSFPKLENSLKRDEFEATALKTLEEIVSDPNLDLVVTYKYRIKK